MKRKHSKWILLVPVMILIIIWIAEITTGQVPYLDQWTRGPVEAVASTSLYSFFRFMTNFGSYFFMLPFTIAMTIVLMMIYRDWLQGLMFAGGTLVANLLNKFIKHLVQRERPAILEAANAEGFSFPSGHAMISFVAYGLLMYFIVKKIRSNYITIMVQAGFAALITVIGISRYFINVHYLTDILAGFVFGFLLFIGLITLYENIVRLKHRKRPQS